MSSHLIAFASFGLDRTSQKCEDTLCRSIGRKVIVDAGKAHAEWRASLRSWTTITEDAEWRHIADLRLTFNTADPVGPHVVFNIAHGRARLIAIVNYQDQRVTVTKILRHDQYNREDLTK